MPKQKTRRDYEVNIDRHKDMSDTNTPTDIPTDTSTDTSTDIPKKIKKRIKPIEMLKMRLNNLTVTEIAKLSNTTPSNVTQRLTSVFSKLELLCDKKKLAEYKEKKNDILTATEFEIIKYMLQKGTLKAASLNNLAYTLQNVNNINRLEQGKSTQHLDIHSLISVLQSDNPVNPLTCININTPQPIDVDTLHIVVEDDKKAKSLISNDK